MIFPRFDIFRIDQDGSLFWMGTAHDVTEAQKLVARQQSGSRDFILFDLKNGTKLAMKSGETPQQER